MAFWAKKKPEVETDKKEAATNNLLKKKDDKKNAPPKRIDNLRIAQKLNESLKSLGTGNEYHFLTKDLSATGMFVLCTEHKRYPFLVQSTLIETVVHLQAGEGEESHELRCLCKIARIVEGSGPNPVSGFGVRMIQISPEQRIALEQFIAKHGSPENFVPYSGGGDKKENEQTSAAASFSETPDASASESSEIGIDTQAGVLSQTA